MIRSPSSAPPAPSTPGTGCPGAVEGVCQGGGYSTRSRKEGALSLDLRSSTNIQRCVTIYTYVTLHTLDYSILPDAYNADLDAPAHFDFITHVLQNRDSR